MDLATKDALKEQGYWITRGLVLRVLDGVFVRAPDHCRRAAAQVAHLVMEPLTGLLDLLPSRKTWSGRDGEESSDYVDGWNDALDAAGRVMQDVAKKLADEIGRDD